MNENRNPLNKYDRPFQVYKSSNIIENLEELTEACDTIRDNITKDLMLLDEEDRPKLDSAHRSVTTWNYQNYNFWTYAINTNPIFIKVWEDLVEVISNHAPKGATYALVQSWLNYDTYESIEGNLTMHTHDFPMHGFVAIEPQKTKTVFEKWEIENAPGNIYFGLGNLLHEVRNSGKYEGPRITVGYDVIYEEEQVDFDSIPQLGERKIGVAPQHNNWIPVVLK